VGGGNTAVFTHDGTTWQQTLPSPQPVTTNQFISPLNFFLRQAPRRTLTPTPPTSLADFGLDPPRYTLTFTFALPSGETITPTLAIGNPTPTGDGIYGQLLPATDVHLFYPTGLAELLAQVE
jgi:hypothetical protein